MFRQTHGKDTSEDCFICNKKLSPLDVLAQKQTGYKLCGSNNCKYMLSQKEKMLTEQWDSHLRHHRLSISAEKDRIERQAQQELLVDTREKREHEKIGRYITKKYKVDLEKTLIVSIPKGLVETSVLPAERKAAYISNLKSSMREALSANNTHTRDRRKNDPLLQPVYTKNGPNFCATCKGGCCTMGKNKGYISSATLRQKLSANPQLSADEIVDKYISFIPSISVTDSCINHSTAGCTIPRDWRSDTCNRFFCGSLKKYFQHQRKIDSPVNTIIVQRDCTHWNRYALDQENRVTEITFYPASGRLEGSIPIDVDDMSET